MIPRIVSAIESSCARFESQWLKGVQPQISDFLTSVDVDVFEPLLRELLHLEMGLRHEAGEHIQREEYLAAYPQHPKLVEQALVSITQQDPSPAGFSRYELGDEIGRGGMGVVYRATDHQLVRSIAIKVMLPEFAAIQEASRRFEFEARTCGNLQHPGVPPVYDSGYLPDGRHFFAMRLVEGTTLAEILKDRSEGQDDLPHLLNVFSQVCQTVAYAHELGVIHRDLKPHNVMVGRFGEVQVMDWGLAKWINNSSPFDSPTHTAIGFKLKVSPTVTQPSTPPDSSSHPSFTLAGSLMGTPAYLSPEQAQGKWEIVGPRSDVFSLGAILCQLLTGKPPYYGDDVRAAAMAGHTEEACRRLTNSGRDANLVELATSCLEFQAENRPAGAAEVAQAVSEHLDSLPARLREVEIEKAASEVRNQALRLRQRLRFRVTLIVAGILMTVAAASIVAATLFHRSELKQRQLVSSNRALAENNDVQRMKAEESLAKSRQSLADMYRENGLRSEESQQLPLAALWFSEAARIADGYDRRRCALNAVRAKNALRLSPRQINQFPSGQNVDRLSIHPSGEWLISTASRALNKDYLWKIDDGRRQEFPAEAGVVTALAWSSSGDLLAAGTDKGQVHIFQFPDFESPVMTSSVPDQPYMIRELEFSPDGHQIAAIRSKHVMLFSSVDLTESKLDEYHPSHIRGIGFSQDSRTLYSFSEDDICRVFATDTKEVVLRTPHFAFENGWTICRPIFADEGRIITWDRGVVWTDLQTEKQERTDFAKSAFQMTWVPPLKQVFVTCNGLLNGYLCQPGEPLEPCGTGNRLAAFYSAERNELLSGGSYRQYTVHDVGTGDSQLSSLTQPSQFRALEMTPDGRRLATADYPNTIHIWDHPPKNEFFATIPTGEYPANGYASSDSKHVLIRRTRKNTQVYDLESCEPAGPELTPMGELIESAWHPNQDSIFTLARTDSRQQAVIDHWDWRSGQRLEPSITIDTAPADSAKNNQTRMVIHPHGRMIAFVSEAERCVIASLDSPKNWREVDSTPCNSLFASSSGNSLILVTKDEPLHVNRIDWSGDDGVKKLDRERIGMVRLMPDGNTLAISTDNGFFLTDAETLEATTVKMENSGQVWVEGFSADNQLIAMRSSDGYARTLRLDNGDVLHPPVDNKGDVVGLTPDGRIMVMPHRSGSCRLIDTATGSRICPVFSLGQAKYWAYSGARQINISPDSRFIVIGGTPHIAIIDLESLMSTGEETLGSLIREVEDFSGHRMVEGRPAVIGVD